MVYLPCHSGRRDEWLANLGRPAMEWLALLFPEHYMKGISRNSRIFVVGVVAPLVIEALNAKLERTTVDHAGGSLCALSCSLASFEL